MQGYDLVAVSPEKETTARIQVKSRWATDAIGFLVKNYDCDFIVLTKLNRGFRYKNNLDRTRWSEGRTQPESYIFPAKIVKKYRNTKSRWGQVTLENIPGFKGYKERWDLIRTFLSKK
jgi:hypothetical protein